jgi:hypothetical protein
MSPKEKEGTRILAKPSRRAPEFLDAELQMKGSGRREPRSANFPSTVLKLTHDR